MLSGHLMPARHVAGHQCLFLSPAAHSHSQEPGLPTDGYFCNQMGQYAMLLALAQLSSHHTLILHTMHIELVPVLQITPEVDSHMWWQELRLHD